MRVLWWCVLLNCSNDFTGFEWQIKTVSEDIVQNGKDLRFETLDSNNVCKCIDSHSNDLDNETRVEMDQQRLYEEEDKLDETAAEAPT